MEAIILPTYPPKGRWAMICQLASIADALRDIYLDAIKTEQKQNKEPHDREEGMGEIG